MLFAVIAMFFCVTSCSGPATPSKIATDCIEYMKEGNYAAFVATLDATDEQKAEFQNLIEEKGKKSIEKKKGIVAYKVLSEEISDNGNKAVVETEIEYGNGKKEKSKFRFVKVDGEWKQVIKK